MHQHLKLDKNCVKGQINMEVCKIWFSRCDLRDCLHIRKRPNKPVQSLTIIRSRRQEGGDEDFRQDGEGEECRNADARQRGGRRGHDALFTQGKEGI